MRCKALHQRNGIPVKVLSRLLWHPAYRAGFPVRFRTATNITHPTMRFNGYWLDIRLPIGQGRYIRLLARLVKQWRNGQRKKPRDSPTENTSLRLFASTPTGNLLSLPKSPKTPHRVNISSTLCPQLALLPPLKRLQSTLLCSLCAIGDAKTQGKTRSFNADCEKLGRKVRVGRFAGARVRR